MKYYLLPLLLLSCLIACSQSKMINPRVEGKVGAPCEGCEAIYECPVKFSQLTSSVEMPDWNDSGLKLIVSGIVYKADGKTPASDVVIYVYHTDQKGLYPKKGNETGWAKQHGYIRSWLKTNEKGEYSFSTLRPAAYPNDNIAAHIHITIKEPGLNEYWIEDFFFDDDPFLAERDRTKLDKRGGSGILTPKQEGGVWKAKRNIILGEKIPGYPK